MDRPDSYWAAIGEARKAALLASIATTVRRYQYGMALIAECGTCGAWRYTHSPAPCAFCGGSEWSCKAR